MKITRTANGLRLSQHGVVISELRTSPGPTHSVFDVLAALMVAFAPKGRLGLLGFAGGGMIAPLHALGHSAQIYSVDLDRAAYQLFCQNCPDWTRTVSWTQSDAAEWLHRQSPNFGLLVEDLSISRDGDVVKPDICWSLLPQLIRRKLRRNGIGIFNVLPPAGTSGKREIEGIAAQFESARVVDFDEFQNRILVAGNTLPSARALGAQLRQALGQLRSRQAGRIQVTRVQRGALQPAASGTMEWMGLCSTASPVKPANTVDSS